MKPSRSLWPARGTFPALSLRFGAPFFVSRSRSGLAHVWTQHALWLRYGYRYLRSKPSGCALDGMDGLDWNGGLDLPALDGLDLTALHPTRLHSTGCTGLDYLDWTALDGLDWTAWPPRDSTA